MIPSTTNLGLIWPLTPNWVWGQILKWIFLEKIGYWPICLKNLSRLQKILNFATRVIFGRRKFDHVTYLREKLDWMPPENMYKFQTMVTAQKVLHHGEPVTLASMFTRNRDSANRNRNTRQDNLFQLKRPRLETGKRSFSYRAATLLNDLPPNLSQLPPSKFARSVKALLKSR